MFASFNINRPPYISMSGPRLFLSLLKSIGKPVSNDLTFSSLPYEDNYIKFFVIIKVLDKHHFVFIKKYCIIILLC